MAEPDSLQLEAIANEAAYDRLISLIENTQGRLAPIIVACDDLKLRQSIISRYEQEARQAQIRPYRIVLEGEPSLRAGLAQLRQDSDYLQAGGAAVFTVTGAETLLRIKLNPDAEAQSQLEKFFGYLQWTREGLQEFKSPIVLWVTYRIFREMRFRAKDFWSWRKAELRFGAELSAGLVDRTGQRLDQLDRVLPAATDDEFLPPPAELQAEIAQLATQDQQAPGLATLYDKLGQVYARRVNRGEAKNLEQERAAAIAAFQQAIARHHSLGDRPAQATSLNQLGNFLESQSRYKEAIDCHQQSLEIKREIGDRNGEGGSLCNLGNAYYSLGQYQRAIDFYEQALIVQREVGNRQFEANSLFNKALALAKYESRRFEAITTLQQARKIYAELHLDHKVRDCNNRIYCIEIARLITWLRSRF